MENLSTQIGAALNDFRAAIDQANKAPRNYNKTSPYQYRPEQSRFKLVIWFKDGNRRTYYSYDTIYFQKTAHIDEYEALLKLIRLAQKHAGSFKNAQIFCTLDPDRKKDSNYNYLVYWAKFNGEIEANKALNFKTDGKNQTAILNRLEMYSPKNFVK